ncbi:MAG: dihydrolipoamide acetyltransferase family protein [Acidimicrobiia bacterium]|nr:MAG: dihydrolipoamide acetyltransferase family protein [Acidimicrobiia bacterium]
MSNEFRMPDIGEGLTEAEIIKWFVMVGDTVEVDQILVEIETAKTVVEIPSPFAGTITSINVDEGETIEVGSVLFVIGGDTTETETGQNPKPTSAVPASQSATPAPAADGRHLRAMPIVRKIATERGIDLSTVSGSGPNGAITRADVELAAGSRPDHELTPMTRVRKTIAHHMAESWRTIPHVTVQAEVRAENLMAARSHRGDTSYPIETLVAEAVLPLLKRYPEFNASIRHESILQNSHYNLGFAIDTDAGLMVVVVKDADKLSLKQLTREFERLARAAMDRTISPEEVTGQTFTISNIGALGGGHGTPIIPLGTSSIMSIGKATQQPVVVDGELAVGLVAPIDLSYDHRLIDGSLGQRFLTDLVESLESSLS